MVSEPLIDFSFAVRSKLLQVGLKSSISFSFLTDKIIFVPHIFSWGFSRYSLVASRQTIPEFLLPSLYAYPSAVPAFLPSRPLGSGPSLFFAVSPAS